MFYLKDFKEYQNWRESIAKMHEIYKEEFIFSIFKERPKMPDDLLDCSMSDGFSSEGENMGHSPNESPSKLKNELPPH